MQYMKKYAEKKPRIKEDRENFTFHCPACHKTSHVLNSAPPSHIQQQCTTRRSCGSLPSLSLAIKCYWLHLGEGQQSSAL